MKFASCDIWLILSWRVEAIVAHQNQLCPGDLIEVNCYVALITVHFPSTSSKYSIGPSSGNIHWNVVKLLMTEREQHINIAPSRLRLVLETVHCWWFLSKSCCSDLRRTHLFHNIFGCGDIQTLSQTNMAN